MAIELFNNGEHQCIQFTDLLAEGVDDVQANQVLIIHKDRGMLLDPGGNKLFSKMVAAISTYLPPQKLDYIVLSHQDPDVGAGLNGYLLVTDAKICFPSIWERFIPAFCTKSLADDRVLSVPDRGMRLDLNGATEVLLPAHFLHSAGNIQVYDPISKTLFSGDLGASLLPESEAYPVVEDFETHIQYMETFHQRYMPSSKVCRKWAAMVWRMDIQRIVPQHGALFEGEAMVKKFIEWIARLECGVERMIADDIYQVPK